MARLNRRGTQRRQPPVDRLAELDADLRADLETGSPIFDRYETIDDMREAWEAMGDQILTEWVAARPGSRPLCWWLFEHQRERPVTGSWATPEIVARHRAECRFGFLHTSSWAGEWLQMPEWEYLHRAGLLTADELARLPVFDPALPIHRQMGSRFRLAERPPVSQ